MHLFHYQRFDLKKDPDALKRYTRQSNRFMLCGFGILCVLSVLWFLG